MPALSQKLHVALGFLLGGALFAASTALVRAERLESDSYIIQFGNFNVTSGQKDSASYNVTDTVGQSFAGPFGSYGSSSYFVGAGFQYIYQIDEFSFRVSQTAVDLGELSIDTFSTASHTLNITTRGAGGYTVYAYELHPLEHTDGTTTIPDTTCDAGTCSQTTAGSWTDTTKKGFGFNMSGHDIPADFVSGSYFRQFADNASAEAMQPVMSSTNIASERESTVTYQAVISAEQAAGEYQTGIVYVAVPGY